MSNELVVAKYQEDVRWLRRVPSSMRVTLYDKSGEATEGIALPNVGRETHTYLTHMVTRYDSLADTTVFCQGRPFDHVPSFHRILRELCEGTLHVDDFLWFGFVIDRDDPDGTLVFQHWSKNPERDPLPMASYWPRMFDQPMPDQFTFYPGAHFAVARETILRKPLSYYEQALETATAFKHVGHCFERTWDRFFGVNGIPQEHREAEMPIYFRPIRRLGITWDSAAQADTGRVPNEG